MKETEGIIEKILSDAKAQAKEIIDKAEYDKAMCEKATNEWVEDYFSAQRKTLKKECEDLIERKLTISKLDKRKIALATKQDIIQDILAKVLERLLSLPKDEYLAYVLRLLEKFSENGDQIVLSRDNKLCKKDFEGKQIVSERNLTFADYTGDFLGGIMLVGKVCDKDLSFKAVLEENKENIISVITSELFN